MGLDYEFVPAVTKARMGGGVGVRGGVYRPPGGGVWGGGGGLGGLYDPQMSVDNAGSGRGVNNRRARLQVAPEKHVDGQVVPHGFAQY